MDIEPILAAFDGRHVAPLRALVDRGLDGSARSMMLAAVPGQHEIAATWMAKAMAERGDLAPEAFRALFDALPRVTEADAILHVLQMVQHAPDLARGLRPHLVSLAGHNRLLVTVWAFDAFCRTCAPGETADRDERIRQGLRHRSKAMQARARALAREFDVSDTA